MSFYTSRRTSALAAIALMAVPVSASAQDALSDSWQWGAELYFWGASLGGETTTGTDIDMGIDKIIEDLNFGLMGTVAAQKGKWTVFGDLIYLDVEEQGDTTVGVLGMNVDIDGKVDLRGVISTLGVGYRVYEGAGTQLDITGGLRYLWLDSTIELSAAGLNVKEEDSGTNIDGVVGFRGQSDINENWYLSYYGDVGTGESDLTWQAAAAINYRFQNFDVALGYRYLDWEFDDFGPFDDLNLSGAFLGAKFRF
ncbi:hypothetical protein [Tropicimonas aquimaris]|uniref:Outer membrane protein beta-barrel domain-containing protein n=1 Tax=Tropicimonas aquimaris TaxID=914152 RepID=A0ABW3IJG6_9RHOB